MSETVVNTRRMGLRDIYIAKVTANTTETYTTDTPIKLGRAIAAKVTVKKTVEKIYSDDNIEEIIENFESADIEIENNAAYKYEYRTGVSGDYTYNYDISGQDSNGDLIAGNIDINGQYGDGSIIDSEGNTRLIDVEWINHGVLEVTDEDGNTYEMEVE